MVSDAASWVKKRFARLRRSDGDPGESGPDDRRNGIQLRRFAGPRAYREQLSRVRVAHLTDLHVGRITPFAVQRAAVEMANAENPDLVVLTGDFVCHSQLYLDQLAEVVKGFKAPTIAVLGNHDYWSGADEVVATLKRAGVEVLRNRNTVIEVAHQRLQIVGPLAGAALALADHLGGAGLLLLLGGLAAGEGGLLGVVLVEGAGGAAQLEDGDLALAAIAEPQGHHRRPDARSHVHGALDRLRRAAFSMAGSVRGVARAGAAA